MRILVMATAMAAISCSACAPATRNPELTPVDSIQKDPSGWSVRSLKSRDGGTALTQREMPAELQARYRNEYRKTNLVQLPIDARFNTTLFKINDVSEYEGRVFVAPKLFAYGSADQGRLAPRRNGDGTVSLSFPVVLTDGTVDKIMGPNSSAAIDLPGEYRIADYHGLIEKVASVYRAKGGLSPLPGCPKKLVIAMGDHEYDATPKDLAAADYCPLNQPFTVTVTLPEGEARFLLEKGLYAGVVDARATFETRVSFVVSQFEIQFDKASLFRDLATQFSYQGVFADVDVRAKVTEIVRRRAMSVNIQGESGAHFETLVSQSIETFFEKFSENPEKSLKECGDARACFRLNANYSREQESLSIHWSQSTSALTGQNYLTWTKLKPTQDLAVRFGEATLDCRGNQCRPMLSNRGAPIETGLTLAQGDLVEITPDAAHREIRELNTPSVSRQDKKVCLKRRRVPLSSRRPCIETKNMWVETTTYSHASPQMETHLSPVGQLPQLFDGLSLRMVWRDDDSGGTGKTREITCPLNSFERHGNGKSLVIRVDNQPNCQIFNAGSKNPPMLSLVSHIDFQVDYTEGKLVRDWLGKVRQSPRAAVYRPRVDLAGTISIKGYSFESEMPSGKKE